MSDSVTCPVCLNAHGGLCQMLRTGGDSVDFKCEICGRFELSRSVFAGPLDPERSTLMPIQRAALSYRLRKSEQQQSLVTTSWLEIFLTNSHLPTPATQALNAIRFIGDRILETGEALANLPPYFFAVIGAPNPTMAGKLALELKHRGLLDGIDDITMGEPPNIMSVSLTLDGWERYESEKEGKMAGRYGFLAMRFGDPILDPFVESVVKPIVKDAINYDVIDMRDVAQAGIIDNIMRAQIRDAAFVIVDLTHDNSGAYWEAGYAEGLGKPVIYICEKTKFDEGKTHFDTNHCTTVLWTTDETEAFKQQFIATLRRSLNLFPNT